VKGKFKDFSNLFSIVKKNFHLLFLTAFLSIVVSFINVALIRFEKELTDAAVLKSKELFLKIFFGALIVIGTKIPLEYIKAFLLGKFSEKSLADIKNEICKKLIFSPISYIEKNATGDFISRLTSDLSLIQNFISGALNDLLYHPVVFVIGTIYAITLNWQMTLICFAIIPVTIIAAIFISKPVEKYTKRQQDLYGDVNAVSQDAISGIAIVKAFLLERHFYDKFKQSLYNSFLEGLKSAKVEVLLEPVKAVIQIGPILMVFFAGGVMVIKGDLSFGGLIAFVELINIFLAPMNILPNIINSYRKAKAASERINEILEQSSEVSGSVKHEKNNYEYAIEFEDVWFWYDEGSGAVLKGINLKVKKGEKVAIVGSSGSGKSTLTKLILGLYRPQKGNLKVFGISTFDWDINALREKISVVNQDLYLFPGSIGENIKYGRYSANFLEVKDAAKKACIYDFVQNLPNGFESDVSEGAVNLSGGQKQRITIARAILKGSEIFIFDEATSALDTESEQFIQNTLDEIFKGKTAIIIAHRFSTIKNVDRIIVIDDGKIAEEGTHDELFNKKGIYYQLYSRQFQDQCA